MSLPEPFELLSDMAIRARNLALELPPMQNSRTHADGLGFNLLGQRFVSSMDDVSELMRTPQTTRVPGVKNFVLGVGNVRGRLMTVIDLALFFGKPSSLPKAQRRLLAVDNDESLVGFVIDDSLGMQHFPADSFSEDKNDVAPEFETFVRGIYDVAGVRWPVLSLKSISQDPRLENLAISA